MFNIYNNKKIECDKEYLREKKIIFIHLIPCYNTYDIIYFNGRSDILANPLNKKILKYDKCEHNSRNITESKKLNIRTITNNSSELNNKIPINRYNAIYLIYILIICYAYYLFQ